MGASLSVRRRARGPWAERLGRVGFAAKGVLYGVVAAIAANVALGKGGPPEGKTGALHAVAAQPVGSVLLAVLAAGLAAYALWRLVETVLGPRDADGAKALGKRAVALGKAVLYGALCVLAVGILFGVDEGGSGEERRATAMVLDLPFGVWLVALTGVGVLVAAGFNGYRAATQGFCDDLRGMSAAEERLARVIGTVGHLARMVVFALIGVFLVEAALEFDPNEAGGLDEALTEVVQQPFGPALLGVVAAGLLAYGLFCLFQARYRDL